MPYIFVGIDLQRSRLKLGSMVTTLAFAGLLLAHVPSVLIALPAVGLYVVLVAVGERRATSVVVTCGSFLLACALCGGYLGTALTHTDLIRNDQLFDGQFRPEHWLFGAGSWPHKGVETHIVAATSTQLGAAAGLLVLIGRTRGTVTRRRLTGCSIALLLLTTFFMSDLSRFFWMMETPLNRIQFPWRLLGLQCIAVSMLTGIAWERCAWNRPSRFSVKPASVAMLVVGALFFCDAALYASRAVHEFGHARDTVALVHSPAAPEYVLGDLASAASLFPDGRLATLVQGDAVVQAVELENRAATLSVEATQPSTILLRQFDYSGWSYRIDAAPARPAGRYSDTLSIVALDVEPGKHRLEAWMPPTLGERLGWFVSCFGAALLLALILAPVRYFPSGRRR